jgi:hypothetical protein
VSFAAVAGTVYRIAVDGYDGVSGAVVLHWAFAQGNDNFVNGQAISGSSGSVSGSNVGATKEAGEPNHAGSTGGKSIWYFWTAPGTGPVSIDTQGSSFDTLLGVYTGNSVAALSLVASSDDTETNLQSRVLFTAAAGTVYRIAVDGYSGSSGSVRLNWGPEPSSGAPVLRLGRNGNQIVITWPTNYPNFALQNSTALTSGAPWSAASPLPVIVNSNYIFTATNSGGGRFYRLRAP